jgi:hypothetical protein
MTEYCGKSEVLKIVIHVRCYVKASILLNIVSYIFIGFKAVFQKLTFHRIVLYIHFLVRPISISLAFLQNFLKDLSMTKI